MHHFIPRAVRIASFAGVTFALAACGGHSGSSGAGTGGGILPTAATADSTVKSMAVSKPCFYPNPCTLAEWAVPTVNPATGTSYPNSIVAGPDGALWFTEWDGNKIGRITTSGSITEFANGITPMSNPSIIRVGPGGNLWFSESNGSPPGCTRSAVAKITTAGVVTEYSGGIDACADPYGIVSAPDGNIWFIGAFDGQGLYKLAPSSSSSTPATLVNHASPNAQANNIIVGPDGNLWFAEVGGAIGKYTFATGAVTEYPVPSPDSQPYDIVNGPDGNMWFTEYYGGSIGRVTPAGVVTEFSAGLSPGSGPNGITMGSDGNLWFVDANTGGLGSLNPLNPAAGGHEYLIPASTINGGAPSPLFITTGSDGNLWFTEWNNVIARVNPLTVTASWQQVGGSTATPPPPACIDKDDLHQKPGHTNMDHARKKTWKDCKAPKTTKT